MFFTEIRTKNEKRGAIVMDENIDNILKDAVKWFYDNKLTPDDMKISELVHWESCQSIGTVVFEKDDRASFNPYDEPRPYQVSTVAC